MVATNLDTDQEIYGVERRIRFPDRLVEMRLLFRIRDFSFPKAGTYQFTLYLDGDWLAQRRLKVAGTETSS